MIDVYYFIGIFITIIFLFIIYIYLQRKYALGLSSIINIITNDNQVIYSGYVEDFRQYIYHTKIKTCNIENGLEKRKIVLHNDRFELLIIADGIIWTTPTSGARSDKNNIRKECNPIGLDVNTLEIKCDGKFIKQLLRFKENEKIRDCQLDIKAKKIVFISNEGNNYYLDYSDTSSSLNVITTPRSWPSSFETYDWTAPYECEIKKDTNRYQIYYDKKCIGTESFIEPIWLNDYYENDKLAGVVFYHLQSLDENPFISISLLGLDGKTKWTITQQSLLIKQKKQFRNSNTKPVFAGASKNLFVYAIEPPSGRTRIIAVDANNGMIIWKKEAYGLYDF